MTSSDKSAAQACDTETEAQPTATGSHHIDGMKTVPVPGTRFVDLQSSHEPGSVEDLKLRFSRRIIFLARWWENRLNEELRKVGQSHARWITLLWAHLHGSRVNHGKLAQAIGVELPTLIRLLNRLEQEGFVERHALKGQGRAKAVHLTRSGLRLLNELTEIVETTRTEFLSEVDEDKLRAAVSLFDDLLVDITKRGK